MPPSPVRNDEIAITVIVPPITPSIVSADLTLCVRNASNAIRMSLSSCSWICVARSGVSSATLMPRRFTFSLTSFMVDALNPAYSSGEGVLFNKAQTTLIAFPPGRGRRTGAS